MTSRLWGLGQSFPEFQHPFFASSPLVILKVESEKELSEALQQKPDIVFWLDVTTTKDHKLIVFGRDLSSKEMSLEAYHGPKSMAYNYQELKNMHPDMQELKDVISKYGAQRFVLNILDNVDNVHIGVTEALKGLSPEKRILLQSNYNVVMTSIKDLEPFWLYGCSQADLMRFLTFESMWILPAAPFKGDVYISPFVLLGRPAFHESTLEEVRRRNKKIVLGPALDKKEFDDATRLKVDGLIVEKLSDFLEWSRP
jgi:glycerophosphoryl diester phosphodiesterase